MCRIAPPPIVCATYPIIHLLTYLHGECSHDIIKVTIRRQLAEASEDVAAAGSSTASTHRELTAWTPNSCFSACAAELGNPPTFFINIYNDETLGEQVKGMPL